MKKYKVIITGASGMVGKAVMLQCLDSDSITEVLIVNRKPLGIQHSKLKELLLVDFMDLSQVESQLQGFDACFFCAGVSSSGMSEERFHNLTYDLTINFAEIFVKCNPHSLFTYVSGQGTDRTEKSKIMWARVKGKTENKLLSLPFRKAYMFQPNYIHPERGVKSKVKLYNLMYTIFSPFYFLLKLIPNATTSSTSLGNAMINLLDKDYSKDALQNKDINIVGEGKY